jgi:hypothetical protein
MARQKKNLLPKDPPKKPGPPPKLQLITEAQLNGMLPLDYMLAVIRDETATRSRRDRMAIAAAPYCHARMADVVKGKKDQQAEAASMAGIGTTWSSDLEFEDRAN